MKAKGDAAIDRFNSEKGPSDEWFRAFFDRHPELKPNVKPSGRTAARAHMSNEYVLDHFFNLYGE